MPRSGERKQNGAQKGRKGATGGGNAATPALPCQHYHVSIATSALPPTGVEEAAGNQKHSELEEWLQEFLGWAVLCVRPGACAVRTSTTLAYRSEPAASARPARGRHTASTRRLPTYLHYADVQERARGQRIDTGSRGWVARTVGGGADEFRLGRGRRPRCKLAACER